MKQNTETNQEKRGRVRLPLHVYLSYLLVASFLFTGVSFSKYASSASGYSHARVAAFNISVAGEAADALVLDVSDEQKSSDSYVFTVYSNSEVLVTDTVSVSLPETLPEGVTMSMTVNGESVVPSCVDNTYTFTKNFAFGAQTHEWKLSFLIDPSLVSLTEEYVIENIAIHVDAVQLDY